MDLVHVEQLSGSIMMPKEFQFAEVLACQNYLNQCGVANFPIHFVLGTHNKRHNNPGHMIATSDSAWIRSGKSSE